jgi:uncharacterized protein YkwD
MSRFFYSRIAAVAVAGVLFQGFAFAASPYKSAPCEVPGMRELILQQVNAARARGYDCGGQRFAAARPVAWNGQLYSAAVAHSRDMAENNYFSHASPRGDQAEQRVESVGYHWGSVGENIAAGERYTADTVVGGWLGSTGHCRNIMDADFNEVAVACISRPGTTFGSYWTMVLGRRL